jgi:uncharacterized spore protein YtfJ
VDINQFVNAAQDAISVRRVFAAPYEKDGLTVITAARVSGGGGGGISRGGGGTSPEEQGQTGEGGGYGVNAAPAGALVIRDGDVRWVPAIDPNRLVTVVGAVVVAVVLARGWVQSRAIRAVGAAHD